MGVEVVPKGDVFAKIDVVGGGVFDEGAVGGPVSADVVGVWEIGGGEHVVPCDAAIAIDEGGLELIWVRREFD